MTNLSTLTNDALRRRIAEELGYVFSDGSDGWYVNIVMDDGVVRSPRYSTERKLWDNVPNWPESVDDALGLPLSGKRRWSFRQTDYGWKVWAQEEGAGPWWCEADAMTDKGQKLARAISEAWLQMRLAEKEKRG